MEFELSLEFLRVVEKAAIAAARTMGEGNAHKSDQVAVEAMRRAFDRVLIQGTVVIGEGERDEAPMLYIGEKVGAAANSDSPLPHVDIAVVTRSRAPTSAPPARRTPSPSWQRARVAACSTLRTATWKRSSSAPRARWRLILTLR